MKSHGVILIGMSRNDIGMSRNDWVVALNHWVAALNRCVLIQSTLNSFYSEQRTFCNSSDNSQAIGISKETGKRARILLSLLYFPSHISFGPRVLLCKQVIELNHELHSVTRVVCKLFGKNQCEPVDITVFYLCNSHCIGKMNGEEDLVNQSNEALEEESENISYEDAMDDTLRPGASSSSGKRRRENHDDTLVENEIRNAARAELHDVQFRRGGNNSFSDRAINLLGSGALSLHNIANDRRLDTVITDWNTRLNLVIERASQQETAITQIDNSIQGIYQLLQEMRINQAGVYRSRDNHLPRMQLNDRQLEPNDARQLEPNELNPGLLHEDQATRIRDTTGFRGERLFQTFWERKEETTFSQLLITPINYPDVIADVEFCSELRHTLGTVNNTAVEGCNIIFRGTDSKQGALVVNCGTLGTLVWLKKFSTAKQLNCGLIGDIVLAPTFKIWTQSSSITFDQLKAELRSFVNTDGWRLIKPYSERIGSRFLFIGDWGLKGRIDAYLNDAQRRGKRTNNEMKIQCGMYSSPVAIHYLTSPFGDNEGRLKICFTSNFLKFFFFKTFHEERMLSKLLPEACARWKLLVGIRRTTRRIIRITKMMTCKLRLDRIRITQSTFTEGKKRIEGNLGIKRNKETFYFNKNACCASSYFLTLTSLIFRSVLLMINEICNFENADTRNMGTIPAGVLEICWNIERAFPVERRIFFDNCNVFKIMEDNFGKSKLYKLTFLSRSYSTLFVALSDVFQRTCNMETDNLPPPNQENLAVTIDEDIEDFVEEREELMQLELAKAAMHNQINETFPKLLENKEVAALLEEKDSELQKFKENFSIMTRTIKQMQARLDQASSQLSNQSSQNETASSSKRKHVTVQEDLVSKINLSGIELQDYISKAGNLATRSTMCITLPGYPLQALDEKQCNTWITKLNSVYKNDGATSEIDFHGSRNNLGVLEVCCRNLKTVDTLMKFCVKKDMVCVPKGTLKIPKAYNIYVPQSNEIFEKIKGILEGDFSTNSWVEIKKLNSRQGSSFLFIADDELERVLAEKGGKARRPSLQISYKAFKERGWIRVWAVAEDTKIGTTKLLLNCLSLNKMISASFQTMSRDQELMMRTISVALPLLYHALGSSSVFVNHFAWRQGLERGDGLINLRRRMKTFKCRKRKKLRHLIKRIESFSLTFVLLLSMFSVLFESLLFIESPAYAVHFTIVVLISKGKRLKE